MKILILTTAINRPELHTSIFDGYKRLLGKDIQYDWVINIDTVDKLYSTAKQTAENISKLFSDIENINFHFILNSNGSLNRAVRNVITWSKNKLKEFDFVLYLEDDWEYFANVNLTIGDVLLSFEMPPKKLKRKHCVISLANRLPYHEYFEMSPRIFTVPMFNYFIKCFDMSGDLEGSAELIVQNKFKEIKRIARRRNHKFYRMQYPLLKDAGRKFMLNKNIKKGSKYRKNHGGENMMYV